MYGKGGEKSKTDLCTPDLISKYSSHITWCKKGGAKLTWASCHTICNRHSNNWRDVIPCGPIDNERIHLFEVNTVLLTISSRRLLFSIPIYIRIYLTYINDTDTTYHTRHSTNSIYEVNYSWYMFLLFKKRLLRMYPDLCLISIVHSTR